MAFPVYSTSFLNVHALDGETGFEVPPGQLAVIREMTAFWPGPDPGSAQLVMPTSGGTAIWLNQATPSAGAYASWSGRLVIPAGSLVGVLGSGAVDITISGYLLTLP